MYKVFIDGASGTTGLRIKDRLEKRDDLELLQIEDSLRKDEGEISKYINESDVTFLCLPDAAAIKAAELLDEANEHTFIIDTSTAHRCDSGWAYGFPELSGEHRAKIKNAKLIANPGCYASGFIAIIYPLVKSGFIPNDVLLNTFALSGYSGGGKSAISEYEAEGRGSEYDAPRMYSLGQEHKHLKEMKAVCGLQNAPAFIPVICPHKCGMIVSVPFFKANFTKAVTVKGLYEFYSDYYKDEKLIKVRPTGFTNGMLAANAFSGRDDMEIEINGNEERFAVTARFDNLGKGASGAAIQCMNLALGEDEYKSLVWGE